MTDLLRQADKKKKLTLPSKLEDEYHHLKSFSRFLDRHYQKHRIVYFAKATKMPKTTQRSYLLSWPLHESPPIAMSRLKHYDGNSYTFKVGGCAVTFRLCQT
ncbi:hypothetical protein CI610_03173 [invertebrate metagenome]|uniref:Uncharacterized protein n=1 Tax=invertebrate metagenome TaxID=1711999 RepID=A0A2H9T3U3_9ZZZZ